MGDNKQKPSRKQIDNAKEALEVLFATQYINKKKLYTENFLRGVLFGAGTIVGSAIIITLLLWILSVLGNISFLEPVTENIQQSVKETKPR